MRTSCCIAVLIFFASVTLASSQDLPPLPLRESFHRKSHEAIWENYSRQVLLALFPAREKLVRKLDIRVVRGDQWIFAGGDLRKIIITTGFILYVHDEYEYAALLAHELGHRLALHRPPARPPRTLDEVLQFTSQNNIVVVDWSLYRRQELEADFMSLLTTRRAAIPLTLFERFFTESQAFLEQEPKTEYQRSSKQAESLRLQTMRNILDWAILAPLVPARPLPRPLPKWTAGEEAWEAYGHSVLRAMYPNHAVTADRVRLIINDACQLATSERDEVLEGKIELNIKLLEDIVRTPEEFAVVIGHEFGHILTWRDYSRDYLNTSVPFTYPDLWARQQFEADLIATLPLPRGECIWAKVLDRNIRSPLIPPPTIPEESAADFERLSRLRAMCALNY